MSEPIVKAFVLQAFEQDNSPYGEANFAIVSFTEEKLKKMATRRKLILNLREGDPALDEIVFNDGETTFYSMLWVGDPDVDLDPVDGGNVSFCELPKDFGVIEDSVDLAVTAIFVCFEEKGMLWRAFAEGDQELTYATALLPYEELFKGVF